MAFHSAGLPSIGIFTESTDRSMPIVDLAIAIENRGFTGLFVNEHTHIPIAHDRSRFPADPKGEIPERYARFLDPYVALAFVAARTNLEVGPMVSLVAEHDAIALAKATATLDLLSSGRLLLGVGFGWNREEFEDHGLPANVRADVVEETVLLIRRLWSDEVASFSGVYRSLSPSRSWPKPVQKPNPPVLLGAPASLRNFERIVRWADGWAPMASPVFEPVFADWINDLRHRWTDAGRDPSSLQLMSLLTTIRSEDLPRAIERLAELGVQRAAVRIAEGDAVATERRLDRAASALAPIYA